MCLMLGTAAAGEKKTSVKQGVKTWDRVVLVEVTGSRIPQRVIIRGQQVNSASATYVVKNDELSRTGAIDIIGMLSLDPAISRRTH